MKFAIITHTIHKQKGKQLFAYEPYVREMNLWIKNTSETRIVAPINSSEITPIDTVYIGTNITVNKIPSFNILSIKNKVKGIFKIPIISFQIFKTMLWADHIHLRCPGNIGLIGCVVQIFFPFKNKTVKYAGNWDPTSKQPVSYRFQKWIISNTFLTRNCKVLVYGEWGNQTKNIVPFFTASYTKSEIIDLVPKKLNGKINCVFVGAFTKGKQPLLSVKTVENLVCKGVDIELHMYGDGTEFKMVKKYIKENKLENVVFLHGNQSKETIKEAFKTSHFLLFISKSEGWPKVVAEAMFWGCLPIASKVSCVPFMLDNGNRGALVSPVVNEISAVIKEYIDNEAVFLKQISAAKKWSNEYTLNKFEAEIQKLLAV